MRRRHLPLPALAIAGVGLLATVALAQTVDGLDIGAIRSRSQASAAEAAQLSEEVKRRTAAVRDDAAASVADATKAVQRIDPRRLPKGPAGVVDFDELLAGAAANAKGEHGSAPLVMVFVSLSMPEAALRPIIRDVSRAGGVVVFRGFPNNSAKAFVTGLSRVAGDGRELASIGVDPRLFRAFDVKAVPTYVVASTGFDLCDGLACRTMPPPHDAITGNVTVDHALEAIVEGRGPGAPTAAVALANLRKGVR